MDKYRIETVGYHCLIHVTTKGMADQTKLYKNNQAIAIFYGNDSNTNAQKVCDLLNETSRSQGQYPK